MSELYVNKRYQPVAKTNETAIDQSVAHKYGLIFKINPSLDILLFLAILINQQIVLKYLLNVSFGV